jgi:hypothetical protein
MAPPGILYSRGWRQCRPATGLVNVGVEIDVVLVLVLLLVVVNPSLDYWRI